MLQQHGHGRKHSDFYVSQQTNVILLCRFQNIHQLDKDFILGPHTTVKSKVGACICKIEKPQATLKLASAGDAAYWPNSGDIRQSVS